MTLPALLQRAVESWGDLYDHHHIVSVTVRSLHLAGLVVGGGTALAADRQVLRATRSEPSARPGIVAAVGTSHRVVVPALALIVATGLLMTAADAETFLVSRLYWSKMGLVGLLLLNGVGLLAAERMAAGEKPRAWTWLGLTAAGSLVLWLVLVFAGVWLTVAA